MGVIRYISLLLFIGLAWGQSKMDINNLIDRGGLLYKANDDKAFSGSVFEFYENGQKKLNGRYRNGLKNGKWTWWNEEGGTDSTGSYKNGLMNGLWQFYHREGSLKGKGSHKNGEKDGKWTYWYGNGNKKKEGYYKHGNEVDGWVFYNLDGSISVNSIIYSYDGKVIGGLGLNGREVEFSAPYFTEYVRRILEKEDEALGVNIYRDGLKIYTTLNTRLQAVAEDAMAKSIRQDQDKMNKRLYNDRDEFENLAFLTIYPEDSVRMMLDGEGELYKDLRDKLLVQCAFVALDLKTGAILAMIGGRPDYHDQYNRAVQAKRQPGSVFKPFVYTTALDNGYPVTEQLLNQSMVLNVQNMDGTWVKWEPQNYDGSTGGLTTLREGLRKSMNLISVRMVQELVPAEQIKKMAKRMGITTDIRAVDAIALGTSEVIPLELVSAYAAFANRGVYSKPFAITRIEDRYGHVVKEYFPDQKEVLSAETAYLMTSLLQTVLDRGTGGSARWKYNFNRPAAGKTGTTQGWSDAWFVGYTPQIATGVWFGVDDFQVPLGPGQDGSRAALPAWARFMREAHDVLNYKVEKFEMPKGVQYVEICSVTKKVPLKACPTESEVFQVGTEPIQACKVHRMDREVIPSTKVNTVVPPNFYKVPNLFGLSQNKAVENLVRSGLKLGKVFYRQNEDLIPYTVLDQSISADTILEESTHVDLTVSVLYMQDIFNQIDK